MSDAADFVLQHAARPHDDAPPPQTSPFEALVEQGFAWLRFPQAMERRFQHAQADERMQVLRWGDLLSITLSAGLLFADWMMVPDRFMAALQLRVLGFVPLLAIGLLLMGRMPSLWREWMGFVKSLCAAGIIVYLCLSSHDELAAPYLVSLSLILLFNGGVSRVRFWPALAIDLGVLAMFAAAVANLASPNVPVMAGIALVMVSTALFTLYHSYTLEHEERANWLMLQHEHLLLERLEQDNARLDQLTRFDPLTEIANRRHFDDFAQRTWTRASRSGERVAVLMFDVDHFKLYNDHYGHPEGDACLKEVAATLGRHLRKPGDLVARFGGEEFVAVLAHTSPQAAWAAAERVRQAVQTMRRPHAASLTDSVVTVSVGVAVVQASLPGASMSRLLARADEALYAAKTQGRNRCIALSSEDAA